MSAPDIVGPEESAAYVPAFKGVLPGGMSGFGAEGVAVDKHEKWCQASLSVLGTANITAVDAVAILDSGSRIPTMSVGVTNKLQEAFPDVEVVGGMYPGILKVAGGRVLAVEQETCPVRIALHTSWGLVTLDSFYFFLLSRGAMWSFSATRR